MLDVCLRIFELNKLSINMSLIIATNIIYILIEKSMKKSAVQPSSLYCMSIFITPHHISCYY